MLYDSQAVVEPPEVHPAVAVALCSVLGFLFGLMMERSFVFAPVSIRESVGGCGDGAKCEITNRAGANCRGLSTFAAGGLRTAPIELCGIRDFLQYSPDFRRLPCTFLERSGP